MPDEKKRTGRKVNAFISDELYFRVSELKYKTWTEAIIKGLELLIESTKKVQLPQEEVQNSTDSERGVHKVQVSELRALIDEKDEHIETLKQEVERISQMYDLHVKQTQTLINQLNDTRKQIETSEPKKPFWKFW